MPSEQEIEQKIKIKNNYKNINPPRLTPEHINGAIESDVYYVFPNTCHTVCCLTLKNGFTVLGESACASPENYDKEIGEKIAYANAREKIWALEGYLLKQKLFVEAEVV